MLDAVMRILFLLSIASFFAMLWAGYALTRHIRKNAVGPVAQKPLLRRPAASQISRSSSL